MKDKNATYNAEGKIILDRAYIEYLQKRTFIIMALFTAVPFVIMVAIFIPIAIKASVSNGSLGEFGIAFPAMILFAIAIAFLTLRKPFIYLRAVMSGTYLFDQDVISNRYTRSDSEGGSTYYIMGAASGKHTVNRKLYQKAQTGETFWYASVQTKKKLLNCAAFPSSSFALSDEMALYVGSRPAAAGPGVFDENLANVPSAAPVSTAPYAAANDHKVTSHYRASHGKVTCASCGKKFDCHKHGDTCPRCGAVRVK